MLELLSQLCFPNFCRWVWYLILVPSIISHHLVVYQRNGFVKVSPLVLARFTFSPSAALYSIKSTLHDFMGTLSHFSLTSRLVVTFLFLIAAFNHFDIEGLNPWPSTAYLIEPKEVLSNAPSISRKTPSTISLLASGFSIFRARSCMLILHNFSIR